MIGIRTDANDKIAMGHLMRCLSIAKQLKRNNLDVLFILSEDYAAGLILENGFRFICLHNRYDQKQQETKRLRELILMNNIDKLLIDSYEVTLEYMRSLREVCRIIYIDDLNKFRYPADLIINYTYGTDSALYSSRGYQDEHFLLGSNFVPLRPEFSQERVKIRKDIAEVFLSTGGTDEFNMVIQILKRLQKGLFKYAKKNVITGKFYKNIEELESMCRQDHTICNYHDIQDICSVMRKSDLAISAGGTTVSELCACGIPIICFSIADNQHAGIKAYADAGMLLYAGDVRDCQEEVLDKIINMAEVIEGDASLRNCMGAKAKKIIDGKGAYRIADAIKSI